MTNFLNSVSMEYVVIGLAGALALALILVIVALVKVSKLKKRYEKFLSGKDGKSLEESIIKKFEKINEIIVEQDFLEGEIQRIDEEHKSSFSKMEVYKYNAFSDMGGETSFVIALLDHNNNGTLLNGMSSQNATYVYAKEIKNGAAKVALSNEEKTTLEKCMNKYYAIFIIFIIINSLIIKLNYKNNLCFVYNYIIIYSYIHKIIQILKQY